MAIHIGTSGWSYDGWEGIVYPHGSTSRQRLAYYVRRFATVEVNNSFYGWPKDETFATWGELLPDGFLMSVKAARNLTHYRKLREPGPWLARMAQGLSKLGQKQGVLLAQLPPQLPFHRERLARFLLEAPSELKLALEFRHPSWNCEETFELLERHHAAYCVTNGPKLPCLLRVTAPFAYVRFHGTGDKPLYAGSYPNSELSEWAATIREWDRQGRDVFAYFNNDASGHAVANAETLRSMCGEPRLE
jgi:uncharacterized protein YecE (DUF72 family)